MIPVNNLFFYCDNNRSGYRNPSLLLLEFIPAGTGR